VTPWAIAWNETQRMAIESDPTFAECTPKGGEDGMKAARAMALISYRGYEAYNATQQDKEENIIFKHRVNSYQRYQGQKLADRFNAYSYYRLSQSIDSHDIGRGRGGVIQALNSIKANAVIVGISTDILFPVCEQKFVADHIQKSYFEVIESDYGHDGFLLEYEKLSRIFRQNMI
jgi:homoserine O-acetyltransferase